MCGLLPTDREWCLLAASPWNLRRWLLPLLGTIRCLIPWKANRCQRGRGHSASSAPAAQKSTWPRLQPSFLAARACWPIIPAAPPSPSSSDILASTLGRGSTSNLCIAYIVMGSVVHRICTEGTRCQINHKSTPVSLKQSCCQFGSQPGLDPKWQQHEPLGMICMHPSLPNSTC